MEQDKTLVRMLELIDKEILVNFVVENYFYDVRQAIKEEEELGV
jgi:hypothetical protein